jgi:hypothetical protein
MTTSNETLNFEHAYIEKKDDNRLTILFVLKPMRCTNRFIQQP